MALAGEETQCQVRARHFATTFYRFTRRNSRLAQKDAFERDCDSLEKSRRSQISLCRNRYKCLVCAGAKCLRFQSRARFCLRRPKFTTRASLSLSQIRALRFAEISSTGEKTQRQSPFQTSPKCQTSAIELLSQETGLGPNVKGLQSTQSGRRGRCRHSPRRRGLQRMLSARPKHCIQGTLSEALLLLIVLVLTAVSYAIQPATESLLPRAKAPPTRAEPFDGLEFARSQLNAQQAERAATAMGQLMPGLREAQSKSKGSNVINSEHVTSARPTPPATVTLAAELESGTLAQYLERKRHASFGRALQWKVLFPSLAPEFMSGHVSNYRPLDENKVVVSLATKKIARQTDGSRPLDPNVPTELVIELPDDDGNQSANQSNSLPPSSLVQAGRGFTFGEPPPGPSASAFGKPAQSMTARFRGNQISFQRQRQQHERSLNRLPPLPEGGSGHVGEPAQKSTCHRRRASSGKWRKVADSSNKALPLDTADLNSVAPVSQLRAGSEKHTRQPTTTLANKSPVGQLFLDGANEQDSSIRWMAETNLSGAAQLGDHGAAAAAASLISKRQRFNPAEDDGHLRSQTSAADFRDDEHKFSEYDDMFLADDYRFEAFQLREHARQKRSPSLDSEGPDAGEGSLSEALESERPHQVQTIYFGGFFPWLADKKTHNPSSPSDATSPFDTAIAAASPAKQRQDSIGHRQTFQATAARAKNEERALGPGGLELMRSGKHARRDHDLATFGQSNVSQQLTATQQSQYHGSSNTAASKFTNSEIRHQLGKFILPAVRLALDHINTNRTILSAYNLEVVPRDTQCNATISLKQFFDMVYEEPKKMLLYGDACRVSTDPIAKASYFFDLIQISYADTDPIYTLENYPNFFRVVPSENALSLARIPFIRHFNWTRVGTIYQNLPRYSLPHSKLLTDLERFQIVIKQSVSLPGSVDGLQNRDLGDELRKLKERDVRIILGNFDEEWALLLFCEAFREKMIGRKYQWLLTGFSEAKLWRFYESRGSGCSKQELLIAMDGYIITDITPVTRSQHRTISGLLAHEYLNAYQRRAREMNISIEENKFYGYVYDGIWAIALALNRVDTLLKHYNRLARLGKVKLKPEFRSISSLLDFQYHQPVWVKLIREALNATKFEGVTGTVSFHKNERPGLITFSQFQAFRDMNEVIVGSYDALQDQLDLNVGFPIIWRGSSPPIDYTIERVTPFRINRTLFVIIAVLALLGIVLACVFLFINIKFRNQRYIKMSSPYLNNLIIIGCILTFTSVIILGLDSGLTSEYNFPYICNARAWVLMAGFTLAFGSMFSKTFRVHSIFTNIKLHKKVIKDYKLFMVVFILLTFDVCILIVWQYFDPFYRETNNGTSIQDSDNEDVIIVPEMEHCQSKRMTIFLGVIYVYKGLLMAFGCFLAWETRHVSIPALNDSKYIGLSVYNVVIMCVIGASLSFILRDQQDASFVIISIFIIFCSTTTLCLVFVPKLIELKQNPRANDHRVRATLKTFKKNYHDEAIAAGCRDIHGNIIGRAYGMNLNDRIKILADENGKQRSLLKEKAYELEALTSKYRRIQSMVQSGQFLQVINTSATTTSSATAHQQACKQQAGSNRGSLLGLCSQGAGVAQAMGTGLLSAAGNQSASNLGTTATTVVLTSRSPTRERVSFSASIYNIGQPKPPQARSPIVADGFPRGQCRVGVALLQQQPVQSSAPAPPTHTHSMPQPAQESITDTGLRSSPIMSSLTQITTTSSTNNATEFTADLCSSKILSSTATGSSGRLAHDDCADLSGRVQAISGQVAASLQFAAGQHSSRIGDKSATLIERRPTGDLPQTLRHTDQLAGVRRRLFRSQEDLDLFTVLSCVRNKRSSAMRSGVARGNQSDQFGGCCESAKLGQWLEGPFCTVLLRQSNLDLQQRGSASSSALTALQRPDMWRHLKSTREVDQQSRHADLSANQRLCAPGVKFGLGASNPIRAPIPRTLSMIEYLCLNDFDLIARRHDKIIRQKRNMTRFVGGCCAACRCCSARQYYCQHHRSTSSGYTVEGDHRTRQLSGQNVSSSCDENASAVDANEPLTRLPFKYSDDFLPTTSLISCSTCCSLASQSYASDLYLYENDQMLHEHSMSSSSTNAADEGQEDDFEDGDEEKSSSTQTNSSSLTESSSIVIGGERHQSGCGRRVSGSGERRHLSESQSYGGADSSSHSSSSVLLHRIAGTCPIHHEQQASSDLKLQPALSSDDPRHRDSISLTNELATVRTSANSSISLIADNNATNGQEVRHKNEQELSERESLCTLGVLYGPAGVKEDANGAAHVSSSHPTPTRQAVIFTSYQEMTADSTLSLGSQKASSDGTNKLNEDADKQQPQQTSATVSIRCDILEEL